MPPASPPSTWHAPSGPWSRIHLDLAGPFRGLNFLVVVDALSGWLEVFQLKATTSGEVIRCLRQLFATFGLPESVMTDNGLQFVSAEFEQFLAYNSIGHLRSAPYHPSTNGQAERAVQTLKESLRKNGTANIELRLQRFLFAQHSTPHAETQRTPAEIMLGRPLRTPMSALRGSLGATPVPEPSSRARCFQVGQDVLARNFVGKPRWKPGMVSDSLGFAKFRVRLCDGSECIRHRDHLLLRAKSRGLDASGTGRELPSQEASLNVGLSLSQNLMASSTEPPTQLEPSGVPRVQALPSAAPRRSARSRRPPQTFSPE